MGDHQIFSLAFLIPSLSIYTFPISFLFSSLLFSAVYSYGKCFCQMASADTMASASLPHKVGGYISLGREIWTQESNWNDAVNGIYGLCAFYYYATSILFSFFSTPTRLSCCLQFSNIFHFWPFHQETKKETINERRPRQGWPTDAKHRLYYPLSLPISLYPSASLSLSLSLSQFPPPCHDSFWPIGNFVISHALCASLMFITHKWTHIDWYFTSSGGLLALSRSQ